MKETDEQIALEKEQLAAVARTLFKALMEILESEGMEGVMPDNLYRNGLDAILISGKHPALRE